MVAAEPCPARLVDQAEELPLLLGRRVERLQATDSPAGVDVEGRVDRLADRLGAGDQGQGGTQIDDLLISTFGVQTKKGLRMSHR
ncbi:MAG: hypothetical protein ABI453_11850 [Isosphaeraceae bacterium]